MNLHLKYRIHNSVNMRTLPVVVLIFSVLSVTVAWSDDCSTKQIRGGKWDFLNETDDELDCPKDTKYAVSLHSGIAQPYGHLSNVAGTGYTANLDIVFPISDRFSWDLRLGYSNFKGSGGRNDIEIADFTANLAYAVVLKKPWVFINGGPGAYFIDDNNNSTEIGVNVGAGLGYPIGSAAALEFTYNYHTTFTGSPDYRFGKIQIGFLIRF